MNLRNRISMKLTRERVEPKLEPKPVHFQSDMEKVRHELRNEFTEMLTRERHELRNEFTEMLTKERDEWRSKYEVELNQLKDIIHYNTMKILHETTFKIDELDIKCNELVDQINGTIDKY